MLLVAGVTRGVLAWILPLVACRGGATASTGTGLETSAGSGSSGTGAGTETGTSGAGSITGSATTEANTGAVPTTSTGGTTDASAAGTSSGSSSSGTTGDGDLPPALASTLITDMNRAYVEMHGGWGPHLRGLMRDAEGALWFTVDAGESVYKNQQVRYFRRGAGEPAWSLVAEQTHGDGVQQNAGSVLLGNFIYTYGVNTTQHYLEECYLDVTDPAYRACNAVTIGGQIYPTPPNSNYIGAAMLGDGARIVWFTVVGENGGPGQFVYTYNYGGGWNGPVAGPIAGGGNDVGYVHAMATAGGELALVAQTYFGAYPNGSFGAGVADVTPGQVANFLTLESPDPAAVVRSSADLYLDAESGAAHVLAYFDGAVAYYHRPGGASWDGHLAPLHVFPDSYRARFVRPAGERLWIVRGGSGGQGVTLHRAQATALTDAIDWAAADAFPVAAPAPGFGAPTAIYVESPTYQRTPVEGLNFAVCGEYTVSDRLIYHFAPM